MAASMGLVLMSYLTEKIFKLGGNPCLGSAWETHISDGWLTVTRILPSIGGRSGHPRGDTCENPRFLLCCPLQFLNDVS
jgi:hypothetical protein